MNEQEDEMKKKLIKTVQFTFCERNIEWIVCGKVWFFSF